MFRYKKNAIKAKSDALQKNSKSCRPYKNDNTSSMKMKSINIVGKKK